MSSIGGVPYSVQYDSILRPKARLSEEWVRLITIIKVYFPSTSVSQNSGQSTTIIASIDPRGITNAISTELVHQVTGLPKATLDAYASESLKVNVGWVFSGQQDPIHTLLLCLTADTIPWIVFPRDLQREWGISANYQYLSAQEAPLDRYGVNAQVPHCTTCGKEITRSKQRCTTVSRYCWVMPGTSSGNERATPTWGSPSQVWDDFDPAQQRQQRQRQVSNSILESTRRIATEAYMDSGSTQELGYAQELSQRLQAERLRRGQGIP